MRLTTLGFLIGPFFVFGANVILSNDDGWAEINVRTFYEILTNAGESVVLSAPAENESGTGNDVPERHEENMNNKWLPVGSSDAVPATLTQPCEFNSCPSGSPAEGNNATTPRLNYVNSYPVTSMRYGIQTLAPKYFETAPDIAVAGFNVGANLGSTVMVSGTVGAATEAAKEGIPGIAFSGTTGSQTAYTAKLKTYMVVYAQLSTMVTQTLLGSGKPYLPNETWLNVNYPAVSETSCSSPSDFKFVLSRINDAGSSTTADVRTCGSTRLPTETVVTKTAGCYASISVGEATSKSDANQTNQATVLGRLQSILSCLPSD